MLLACVLLAVSIAGAVSIGTGTANTATDTTGNEHVQVGAGGQIEAQPDQAVVRVFDAGSGGARTQISSSPVTLSADVQVVFNATGR